MICANQLRECCLFWPLAKIIYIIVIVLGHHVPMPKDNQVCARVRLLRAWWAPASVVTGPFLQI